MEKIRLIYILSFPRSGSTLLGNLIELHPQIFHAGEVERLWVAGPMEKSLLSRICGCSNQVKECEVWQNILNETARDLDLPPGEDLEKLLRSRLKQPRHFEFQATFYNKSEKKYLQQFLKAFYKAIAEVTKSRIIVDSSKTFPFLNLLLEVPEFEVTTIYLTRDPRGVINSRSNRLLRSNKYNLPSWKTNLVLLKDIIDWNLFTLKAKNHSAVDRVIHYESLVSKPADVINAIFSSFDLQPFKLEGDEFDFPVNHTIHGSLSRFKSGRIPVKEDLKWKRQMSRSLKFFTTLISSPFMVKEKHI